MNNKIIKFLAITILTVFFVIINYNFLPFKLAETPEKILAQSLPIEIIKEGKEVLINNKKANLPWVQWQEGNNIYIGVSDVGAEAMLGIELMNTNEVEKQPINWFGYYKTVLAKFINPYRYIDLTPLTEITSLKLTVDNDILNINLPIAQVNKAYEVSGFKGKEIILELDTPTFFQVSQGRKQGFIRLESQVNRAILAQFKPVEPEILPIITEDEGDKILGAEKEELEQPLFTITEDNQQTLVTINLPPAHNLKVNSAQPNLLFIELKPDALIEREIKWSKEIEWRKKYVAINSDSSSDKNSLFLVNSLVLNLDDYKLDILPITPNQDTVIGAEPLKNTAENLQAIAAINGGFFNRNNKLPLGVIKNRNQWLSSPILNRGVIAWDDVGNIKMGRLALQETITINNQDRLVGNYINSGYIQPGISRYTDDWGESYTTLSDNEVIIVVENEIIRQKITAGKAGEDTIFIPFRGYILTLRKVDYLANRFGLNQPINVQTFTTPADFAQYPYMMGAGPLLLLNRQIVLDGEAENFSKAFNQQKASRSAIAVNNQGKLMLVAVHNRVGGAGPSLLELAQILRKMGAIDALNLDGGSSTQIYLGGQIIDRSPATAARVNNGIGVFLRQRN